MGNWRSNEESQECNGNFVARTFLGSQIGIILNNEFYYAQLIVLRPEIGTTLISSLQNRYGV